MGYNNGNPYNQDLEYAKKSVTELMEIRAQFEEAVAKHPEMKTFVNHLQYVRECVAKRVGRK